MPTEQRASERLRGRWGVWPHGTGSLTSAMEPFVGARLTEKFIQKAWGRRQRRQRINAALRVFHYQYLSRIRFTFKVPVL